LLPGQRLAESGPRSRRHRSKASGRILYLAHIHPIGGVPQIVAEQLREDEEEDYGDGGIDDDMLVDFDLDI